MFLAINWTGKFIVTGKVCKQNFEKVSDFYSDYPKHFISFLYKHVLNSKSLKKKKGGC